MKNISQKNRSHSAILVFVILSTIVLSCENKIPVIPKSDLLTLPSLTVKNDRTIISDSGRVQLIMSFPILEKYDKADPKYSEFKSGIHVVLFNTANDSVIVTSKYAKNTNDNLWELRDSVVVINENNEKLETEVLFWNQEKDLIYTDRFVKMTSEDEVMQGIGLETNSHLNPRRILKVTAEIYIKNEK
jgi:LPS export ABC transporter protein LptC